MSNAYSQRWKVRFLNLSVKSEKERNLYASELKRILQHGQLVLGPEVQIFENSISSYCNRHFSVGVGSGTDALICAIKSLQLPIGSEIITTPLSWVASTNSIVLSGMKPVFADIDNTLNINVESVGKLVTNKTKAILAVDFAGQPCNYTALRELCEQYNLTLIQDASQALGAQDNIGKCGGHGDVSAVSHNPMKTLSAFGEAGSVMTDRKDIAERLRILRYAGTVNREECVIPSSNSRLDTIQAAFLLAKLKNLDKVVAQRNQIANRYNKELSPKIIRVSRSSNTVIHAYYTYQILYNKRDDLVRLLEEKGIETKVQHRLLIPHHQYYKNLGLGFQGSHAEEISKMSLCLPCNENLLDYEQSYVIDSINQAIKHLS